MIQGISRKAEWMQTLKLMGNYDCYHTYDYHQITKEDNTEAILIVFNFEKITIALPLIIRPISGKHYDATSGYGYPGPVCNGILNFNEKKIFKDELKKYFKSKNIISVFSRLNPYIENQEILLDGIGSVDELGDVVNIDLKKGIETQRQLFSKTTKRYLNKARKLCYTRLSKEKDDILKFIDLYYENMNRVNAEDYYYFDQEYFMNIINATDFETDVIFAHLKESDEIISAAMIMKTNNIIQYHISGTKNDYLGLTPIRLLLDEVRISGTYNNYEYFNLGGGLGSEHDSLFYFKSSFSKDFKKFKVWKYIVDKEIYNKLCKENKGVNGEDVNFFPLYRYNK